jgi:hypothetical protein
MSYRKPNVTLHVRAPTVPPILYLPVYRGRIFYVQYIVPVLCSMPYQ